MRRSILIYFGAELIPIQREPPEVCSRGFLVDSVCVLEEQPPFRVRGVFAASFRAARGAAGNSGTRSWHPYFAVAGGILHLVDKFQLVR